MTTTVLDILGALLIVGFAAIVWWPAALFVAGALCLVSSWAFERQRGDHK